MLPSLGSVGTTEPSVIRVMDGTVGPVAKLVGIARGRSEILT